MSNTEYLHTLQRVYEQMDADVKRDPTRGGDLRFLAAMEAVGEAIRTLQAI